jgi:hypothetical protein
MRSEAPPDADGCSNIGVVGSKHARGLLSVVLQNEKPGDGFLLSE